MPLNCSQPFVARMTELKQWEAEISGMKKDNEKFMAIQSISHFILIFLSWFSRTIEPFQFYK